MEVPHKHLLLLIKSYEIAYLSHLVTGEVCKLPEGPSYELDCGDAGFGFLGVQKEEEDTCRAPGTKVY